MGSTPTLGTKYDSPIGVIGKVAGGSEPSLSQLSHKVLRFGRRVSFELMRKVLACPTEHQEPLSSLNARLCWKQSDYINHMTDNRCYEGKKFSAGWRPWDWCVKLATIGRRAGGVRPSSSIPLPTFAKGIWGRLS